jgi:hypothetical protein
MGNHTYVGQLSQQSTESLNFFGICSGKFGGAVVECDAATNFVETVYLKPPAKPAITKTAINASPPQATMETIRAIKYAAAAFPPVVS